MEIPSFKYSFNDDDIEFITSNIRQILKNGEFLTMGKFGDEFESLFKEYNESSYAIAMNSGTSALEVILSSLNLKGKEVLVPTNTFTATIIPVLNVGATPVFVDCCEDLCLSPYDLRKKITSKTGAVITVHIGGYISPHIYEIQDFCNKNGLYLIEDAAHAQGSTFNGKKAGNFGIASAFSFFSTKVITTGEGGMVVTDNREIFESAVIKRNHGQQIDNYVDILGNNWRMHEFSAVTGLSQMKRIDEIIENRRRVAGMYDRLLSSAPNITRLQCDYPEGGNYYKYILRLAPQFNQAYVQNTLKEKYNISLGGYVYPLPCHKQKVFREYFKSPLPMAEELCSSHICLPIFPQMTEEEVLYVADSLLRVVK